MGATTKTGSGTGFAAAWFAPVGLGLGLAMPQTMNAALCALSAERSGSGSALISALRQVGATIGVAVLGTVLASVYRSHLAVTGLPAAAAAAARSSVVAGVEVAHAAGSAALLDGGPQRVRAGPGHDALGLRRDRAGQRACWRSSSCRAGPTGCRAAAAGPPLPVKAVATRAQLEV